MFSAQSLHNTAIWISIAGVLLLQVAVVNVSFLQSIFDTTHLTGNQWLFAVAVASSVLWIEEVRKAIVRRWFPVSPVSGAMVSG